MSTRDRYLAERGPRVSVFDPSLDRVVKVRKTADGRIPGVDSHRGKPIYTPWHSSGELGHVYWFRSAPDDPAGPGTWTVSTQILCGAFHYEKGAVIDDFGTLVLPAVVSDELWLATRRRASRAAEVWSTP